MKALKLLIQLLEVFNRTERKLEEQDRRIKHLEEKMSQIKDQVALLDGRLDTIESALTTETGEIRAIVKDLEDRVAEVEGLDISPQLNRLSAAATRISGLSEAVVAPPPDVEVPSTPGAPVAGELTATSVALSWQPSSDNVGLAGYEVYANGEKIGDATSESFTAISLNPGSNYVFTVRAKDTSDNFSAMSDSLSVDTPAA
jgi:uncharacterized protein YeeX (DUF496 family)